VSEMFHLLFSRLFKYCILILDIKELGLVFKEVIEEVDFEYEVFVLIDVLAIASVWIQGALLGSFIS
jgi:hypothetical protein